MSQKVYLFILKYGAIASLITVFFTFKSLLFPFITSKQISFNILIEILFIFWIAFIIKYPEYRPKKSYITFGLVAFLSAITLTCFTGVDFNLSFWGDVERMLGVFHVFHFLALYLIIITVFRSWEDWQIMFITSISIAVLVAIYGITSEHAYSTIGNTAYVSGYLIFNMYFSLLLFFREENKSLRWLYILPIIIMWFGFNRAGTNGAFVGLGFSIMVIFFLYAILHKNVKVKIATAGLLVISIITVSWVLTNRDSEFIQNSSVLRPIRGIDVQKNTFQTRLISWRAGIKDFKNHPILGTGFGNFAVIFDRHFDPSFYDYTRGETYFDRAHNNVVDIASTSGLVGILTYLSIFLAAAYYLFKGYRREYFSKNEFIIISGLLTAYFVQNLAVFDSLVTYIGLMMTLSYVYWLNTQGEEGLGEEIKTKKKKAARFLTNDRQLENKEIYALFISGIVLLTIMYQYNVKPLQMLVKTIDGQRALAQGDIEKTIDEYKEALSHETILDRDSRTSLVRTIASNPNALRGLDKARAQEILDYNIELMEANYQYNKDDSLNDMLYAQLLNITATYNSDNPERFMYYSDRALEMINRSINATPGRIPVYFQKSQICITRGDKECAINTLKEAVALSDTYHDSFCHLARTYFYYGIEEEGYEYLDQCINKGGLSLLAPAGLVRNYINHYIELEDWPRVTQLYIRLTQLEEKNVENWVNLAKLYSGQGDNENARKAALKAIEIDPSIKDYANEFINNLK